MESEISRLSTISSGELPLERLETAEKVKKSERPLGVVFDFPLNNAGVVPFHYEIPRVLDAKFFREAFSGEVGVNQIGLV